MRQLKKPITALVDYPLIDARDDGSGSMPATGKLKLAGPVLLSKFQFSHRRSIVQRAFNLLSVRCGEKSLHAKVEACAVTRHGLICLVDFFYHKVQVQIAERITFDCDRLHVRWYVSRLAELVDPALKIDFVAVQQLPARLFQGERRIALHFLKAGGTGSNLALEIAKEKFVGFVNALGDVLNGLTAHVAPIGIFRQLLEFGKMFLQNVQT